jgi:hypothetical protein
MFTQACQCQPTTAGGPTSRPCWKRRDYSGGGGPGPVVVRVRRHRHGYGPAVAGGTRRHRAGSPVRPEGRAAARCAGEQRQNAAVPGQSTVAGGTGGGNLMTGWHVDDETLRRYVRARHRPGRDRAGTTTRSSCPARPPVGSGSPWLRRLTVHAVRDRGAGGPATRGAQPVAGSDRPSPQIVLVMSAIMFVLAVGGDFTHGVDARRSGRCCERCVAGGYRGPVRR